MDNYVVYHLHSDLSNGVTNVDSVTKFGISIHTSAREVTAIFHKNICLFL